MTFRKSISRRQRHVISVGLTFFSRVCTRGIQYARVFPLQTSNDVGAGIRNTREASDLPVGALTQTSLVDFQASSRSLSPGTQHRRLVTIAACRGMSMTTESGEFAAEPGRETRCRCPLHAISPATMRNEEMERTEGTGLISRQGKDRSGKGGREERRREATANLQDAMQTNVFDRNL
eukprot:753146-Hanusia_phi.AAC.1